MVAPVNALPIQEIAAPHAKIDALPIILVTAGTQPYVPLGAIQTVVTYPNNGSYPIADVQPQYASLVAGNDLLPTAPIPVVVVG